MSDERSDLARWAFPKEWARAESRTGKSASKKRQQLRKLAEESIALDELKATGAACATCDGFNKKGPVGPWCEAASDFHGYVRTRPDDLCLKYAPRNSAKGNAPQGDRP